MDGTSHFTALPQRENGVRGTTRPLPASQEIAIQGSGAELRTAPAGWLLPSSHPTFEKAGTFIRSPSRASLCSHHPPTPPPGSSSAGGKF